MLNPTIVVFGLIVAASSLLAAGSLVFEHSAWAQTTSTGSAASPGQKVVQQGIATSSFDPLPGHEAHQSITILRLRPDNGVYSGTLTYTATKPAEIQVLHRNMTASGTNATASPSIPEAFGVLSTIPLPGGQGLVTISNIIPPASEGATTFPYTLPFTGNAIALHNIEGEPFAATWSVEADVLPPAVRNDNIGTAPAGQAEEPAEEEPEEEEPEEEEEEG
jgi:hypothetical protein